MKTSHTSLLHGAVCPWSTRAALLKVCKIYYLLLVLMIQSCAIHFETCCVCLDGCYGVLVLCAQMFSRITCTQGCYYECVFLPSVPMCILCGVLFHYIAVSFRLDVLSSAKHCFQCRARRFCRLLSPYSWHWCADCADRSVVCTGSNLHHLPLMIRSVVAHLLGEQVMLHRPATVHQIAVLVLDAAVLQPECQLRSVGDTRNTLGACSSNGACHTYCTVDGCLTVARLDVGNSFRDGIFVSKSF